MWYRELDLVLNGHCSFCGPEWLMITLEIMMYAILSKLFMQSTSFVCF